MEGGLEALWQVTEPLKSQDLFNLTGFDDHRVTCTTMILRFLVKLVHP